MVERILIAALALLVLSPTSQAADWLQFRGSENNPVVADSGVPVRWSEGENVAWKSPLPGMGVSGPIVVGGKVIVTASSGFRQDRLHVLAFDAETGKLDWHRQYWATGRTFCHPTSAVAANTPASDGQRIFAFFSSNDLICLDLEGNLLWLRGMTYDHPTAANDVGMAASPVVIDDTVVVQIETQGESFAAGIDVNDGKTRWSVPRKASANWASPSIWRPEPNGPGVVLLQSGDKLTAHDAASGKQLWELDQPCSTIPSATAVDGVVYVPSEGITALRVDASGAPVVLWKEARLAPANASPIVKGKHLLILNRVGVLACGDIATGNILWQTRLKGTFWATPIVSGNHLYAVNQDGEAIVVDLSGDKGEIVSEQPLGEAVLGTPVAVDGALYVRGASNLWKISGKSGS